MTFGELLTAVGEHIWSLWPVRIVNPWQTAVRLRLGKVHATVGPGLRLFWPFFDELVVWDTVLDVNVTKPQTVDTADGQTVTFSLALRYRISDLARLLTQIQDYEDTIGNEITASAASLIATMDYADVEGELGEAVYGDVRARLEDWGVELESVSVYTLCRARAIRLL